MAWLAVSNELEFRDGKWDEFTDDSVELITEEFPERCFYAGISHERYKFFWVGGNEVKLPRGTIEKLIGKPLSYLDEPVEI